MVLSRSQVESMIDRNCFTCHFNFGKVCAGNRDYYGVSPDETSKIFPKGCIDYQVHINIFIEVNKELGY